MATTGQKGQIETGNIFRPCASDSMHPSHLSSQLDSPNRSPPTHHPQPPTVATLLYPDSDSGHVCAYVSKHDMDVHIQQHLDCFDNTTAPTQIPSAAATSEAARDATLPTRFQFPFPQTATRPAAFVACSTVR